MLLPGSTFAFPLVAKFDKGSLVSRFSLLPSDRRGTGCVAYGANFSALDTLVSPYCHVDHVQNLERRCYGEVPRQNVQRMVFYRRFAEFQLRYASANSISHATTSLDDLISSPS